MYMGEFKDELQRMFCEGTINDGNKMNLGKMRETLMNIFPHKFSIPSELEIKKFITSEAQKQKKRVKETKIQKREEEGNQKVLLQYGLLC